MNRSQQQIEHSRHLRERVRKLHADGCTDGQMSARLGVAVTTVQRIRKELELTPNRKVPNYETVRILQKRTRKERSRRGE